MGISSALYLQKMYTNEYKHVTWNSTQKIDLFVFQRFRLYNTFPFICEGILFLAMRRYPSFIQSGIKMITKTRLVTLELCIWRVTSVQGLQICCLVHRIQKLKRFFVLITKITRLSLPSASAVSLSQCPLDAEDAGGLMRSPAARLASVWRSGLICVCHSMTRGKWTYNQECLSPRCSLRNLPCFLAAKTGPASVLLAGTLRPGSSWPAVTNGIRHAQNQERGEEREADPERNPADPQASSWGPLQLLLCRFPPFSQSWQRAPRSPGFCLLLRSRQR